jgi:hypothetical protein
LAIAIAHCVPLGENQNHNQEQTYGWVGLASCMAKKMKPPQKKHAPIATAFKNCTCRRKNRFRIAHGNEFVFLISFL